MNRSASTSPTPPRLLLLLTAGICGALVMVIEILGARVIGPFFGVSLFVWTALISVTLLSLAGGYAWGGWLADRKPSADWLYSLIALAGVAVLLAPLLKMGVMALALGAGLRVGTFLAALLLFGPPLFLLGCVSPYLLRLAAADLTRLGRTAGSLYAVSTAGSFVGAALTGFYLLGQFGVASALRLTGVTLIVLALIYFAWARQWRGLAWAATLLPALIAPTSTSEARLPDGTRAKVIAARDGHYGTVKVVEYRGTTLTTREMTIDGLIQGGIDVADGRSIYEYPYLLARLPLAVHPQGKSALVVGLGAGTVPRWLADNGIAAEVVDIDPLVLDAARTHFAFPAAIPVALEDARTFIGRAGANYDYLLLDVFSGDTTPGYLLSLEALGAAKRRLNPQGVLALNLVGGIAGADAMLPAVVRTLGTLFDQVAVFAAFEATRPNEAGNYVILARQGSLDAVAPVRTDGVHPLARQAERLLLLKPMPVATQEAPLLTDDFNPLDLRDTAHKERVRRTIIETTPREILLAG